MLKNKKTTIAGIAAILTGVAEFANAISAGDYSHLETAIAAIVTGVGLIAAKDHNVTGGSVQQ